MTAVLAVCLLVLTFAVANGTISLPRPRRRLQQMLDDPPTYEFDPPTDYQGWMDESIRHYVDAEKAAQVAVTQLTATGDPTTYDQWRNWAHWNTTQAGTANNIARSRSDKASRL